MLCFFPFVLLCQLCFCHSKAEGKKNQGNLSHTHTTSDTKRSSLDMHKHAVDYRKFICLDVKSSGDEEDYGARNNFQS